MTHRTRSRIPVLGAAALALLGGAACGDEGEAAASRDATTADLLSSDLAESVAQNRRQSSGQGDGSRLAAPRESASLDDLGYDKGDPDAPVRLVEFSDFGCGYCRRFHQDVWPTLEEEYVATGKVYWKYVPMILGMFPNAMEAARAGECAGAQDRFAAMQERLFAEQSRWKNGDDPEGALEAMASEVGLDMDRWRQCVDDGEPDSRIELGTRVSRQAGVRGTPTFFIVGYAPIPGALPLEIFREVLDTAYAQAVRGDAPGDR